MLQSVQLFPAHQLQAVHVLSDVSLVFIGNLTPRLRRANIPAQALPQDCTNGLSYVEC